MSTSTCTFLVAIDPGLYSSGVAFFKDGALVEAYTVTSNAKLKSKVDVRRNLTDSIRGMTSHHCAMWPIALEEPFLRGMSNNSMQRTLGAIENEFKGHAIHYIHPMRVKSLIRAKTVSKKSVAKAAIKLLKTFDEQRMVRDLMKTQEWDATDAVAIGLVHLQTEEAKREDA